MNDSENNHAGLEEQISALRCQAFVLLLALIVTSGTLVAFLYYQSRQLGKNIDSFSQQAAPIVQAYGQNRAGIQTFVQQLAAYGATHPDFQPILKKYQIQIPAPAAAPKK